MALRGHHSANRGRLSPSRCLALVLLLLSSVLFLSQKKSLLRESERLYQGSGLLQHFYGPRPFSPSACEIKMSQVRQIHSTAGLVQIGLLPRFRYIEIARTDEHNRGSKTFIVRFFSRTFLCSLYFLSFSSFQQALLLYPLSTPSCDILRTTLLSCSASISKRITPLPGFILLFSGFEYLRGMLATIKLAPHFQIGSFLLSVLFAPAIVPDSSIVPGSFFRNSVDLGKRT